MFRNFLRWNKVSSIATNEMLSGVRPHHGSITVQTTFVTSISTEVIKCLETCFPPFLTWKLTELCSLSVRLHTMKQNEHDFPSAINSASLIFGVVKLTWIKGYWDALDLHCLIRLHLERGLFIFSGASQRAYNWMRCLKSKTTFTCV